MIPTQEKNNVTWPVTTDIYQLWMDSERSLKDLLRALIVKET